jgi:hypothetical protein
VTLLRANLDPESGRRDTRDEELDTVADRSISPSFAHRWKADSAGWGHSKDP